MGVTATENLGAKVSFNTTCQCEHWYDDCNWGGDGCSLDNHRYIHFPLPNKVETMSMDTLADAFYDELRDILSAERQLTKALPKMAKNATNPELKKAFETHLAETETQAERVEKAFEETGKAARAKTCEAMKGLIKEAEELLEEDGEPATKDALLIAAAQKVEHYEIASYGTLCTWAEALGYTQALELLKQNIDEEETTDGLLSQLAKKVNREALAAQ
jgi:ferritin-like metal-binding protein YciE